MAATLPAIGNGFNKIAQSPVMQRNEPSPPMKTSANGLRNIQPVRKSQGKKEREMIIRKEMLRAQQPDLDKRQTAKYRYSYKHNLCIDMLQDGFHKSFAELFALLKQQHEDRLKAGPESLLWNKTMLEDEPDKLDTLKYHLTQAETAARKDDNAEVYACQYNLAHYFQQTGDKWLSDHFFLSCLSTSDKIAGSDGRKAAEGHSNVGLALEESGDYFDAAQNFEAFHKLASDKSDWIDADNQSLHVVACMHLTRIYTIIGNKFESEGNAQQSLDYLLKAFNMAKEGGDKKLEGEASYRLGLAYEKNKDPETALLYLNGYLAICQSVDDHEGSGQACEAIAKSYESQGKIEKSIKYLDMYLDVAEKSKNDKATSKAASDLGGIFNSLPYRSYVRAYSMDAVCFCSLKRFMMQGKYEQAVDYFNKAYNISRTMNDTETISSSRVLYGVAAAHKMMANVVKHVDMATRPCLERMIEWKDNRGDEFEKPIPQPVIEEKQDENDGKKPTQEDATEKSEN